MLTIALGSLCASFLNAASNVINQIYDLEIDRINKPKRPLVTGEVSMRAGWFSPGSSISSPIVPTWWVVVYPVPASREKGCAPLSAHECFFIYVLGMVFTFVYSAPALGRTKRFGLLANVTIAIPRGCLLKVAGWSMVAPVGLERALVHRLDLHALPDRRRLDEGLLRHEGGRGRRLHAPSRSSMAPTGRRRSWRRSSSSPGF